MNMNFQRPHMLELELPAHDRVAPWPYPTGETELRPGRLRYVALAVLGIASLYVLANASVEILLLVIGILVLILGTATAVCVYAQNNSPW